MLEMLCRKRNPPTLLVGMLVGAATMDISMEVPLKTKDTSVSLFLFCI